MKIAFYSPLKPYDHKVISGDRNIAKSLIKLFESLGHEVIIPSKFRSYAKNSEAQHSIYEKSSKEISMILDEFDNKVPDLWFTYHSYYKAPDYFGPLISKKLSLPYIILEASYAKKRSIGEWKIGSREAFKSITSANAIINFTNRDFEEINKIIRHKSQNYILPPFPDTSIFYKKDLDKNIFKKNFSSKFSIPESAPWVLTVGMMRDDDSKLASYEILSKSMNLLNQDYYLLVVGDGPKKTYVKKLLKEAINEKVFFLGEMKPIDLANLYNCCDIFAWPGVNEAFGLSYLEAQACGLPVVAGNSGGVSEVINKNKSGFLVDITDKNPLNFSNAVEKLITDSNLRYNMGIAAENFINRDRTLETTAEKLNNILFMVLNNYKNLN